uniref:RPN1 N-terminal domain-containing protein n=1 Tax=Quercus lobata TaxID=97700 RepID=A0A7N2LL18_QUELO
MNMEPPFYSTSTGPSLGIDPPHVQAEQAVGLPVEPTGRLKCISRAPPCGTGGHKNGHKARLEASDEGHARPPPHYTRQHKFQKRYLPGPDDMLVLDTAYMIYLKFEEYPNALQTALFLDNMGITFELVEEMAANDDDREALQDIINNTKLSEGYLTLARDIEVMEPKSPEDIYKWLCTRLGIRWGSDIHRWRVALEQYALGAIILSLFELVGAIYSFVAMKKKVVGDVCTEAVNCIAAAAAASNGECRSTNVANADVIIVGAGAVGSTLAHTLSNQIVH